MEAENMIKFLNELDTEVKYFIDDFYDNAFKIDLKNQVFFAKRKGGKPFAFSKESEKYRLAIVPSNEVSKTQYHKY